MTTETSTRTVHLVGSVPLGSCREDFELVGSVLGPLMRHIPDGETGERGMWIWTQIERVGSAVGLQPAGMRVGLVDYPSGVQTPYWCVKEGTGAGEISFGPLCYAEWACASYEVFRQVRDDGVVAPGTKFQVSLPTAFAVVYTWIADADRATVLPAYENALIREVAEICSRIPNEDLVFQWDVAIEFIVLENPKRADFYPMEELIENVLRIDHAIPPDVGVGLHLCYGDFGGVHNVDLKDMRLMTEFSNRITERSHRHFKWVHMPVLSTAD